MLVDHGNQAHCSAHAEFIGERQDHFPALLEGVTGNGGGILASFDMVDFLNKLLGSDSVENSVHRGHVLRRTNGTELEMVTSVGEGGVHLRSSASTWKGTISWYSKPNVLFVGAYLASVPAMKALKSLKGVSWSKAASPFLVATSLMSA
jgi:hypothetical protein